MNEKFKSILAKAHLQVAEQEGLPLDTTALADTFATLLVHECIDALWTKECAESDLAYEQYQDNRKSIIQHFGLK